MMSSEALLENPKLFSVVGDKHFHENYITSQLTTVREYIEIINSYPLPSPLFQVFRSHLFKMLSRFLDAPNNLDLREKMSEGSYLEMIQVVDEIEFRMMAANLDPEKAQEMGLLNTKTWYMRHRDEAASKRILSARRTKRSLQEAAISERKLNPDTSSFNVDDLDNEQLNIKLSELKKRLMQKRNSIKS